MRLAYQYRLLPTRSQKARINHWLELCRHQFNYLLAERFSWWEENRCPVNACPLVCHLPPLRDKPEYYGQKRSLVALKQTRPWYKDVHADVLQNVVKRVSLAFERFISGDSNGKKSGRPRFKGRNRYHTFAYARVKPDCIDDNKITLPKLGCIKLRLHRPLPNGFLIKTASVTKKADGFYVTLSLEDKSVPQLVSEVTPTQENSLGVDVGLEKFLVDDRGSQVPIPQYLRHAEEKLAKLQQKAQARKKGSRARNLLYKKVARLHQKIARTRKQFHFTTAGRLLESADIIFVEDLKVKNMARRNKPKQDETGKFLPNGQAAKSGLNKSIHDAGWSQFVNILSYKAEKAGLKVVKVNPRGTSQHCSECLNRVPKSLSQRWHLCSYCGLMLDRDWNAARLIKQVGLGASLTIKRSTRKGREARTVA